FICCCLTLCTVVLELLDFGFAGPEDRRQLLDDEYESETAVARPTERLSKCSKSVCLIYFIARQHPGPESSPRPYKHTLSLFNTRKMRIIRCRRADLFPFI
ncbi:hypothetical protein M5D96_004051, partial [Drosophila gunungcola]